MIKQQHIIGERAIVIGGSIAGLLAARILADYFAEVIIVERDKLPQLPQPRQGVPQSLQPHILLTKGYRILIELFGNDFITQLLDNGALTIDWGREFYIYSEAGWLARNVNPSDLVSITCSRPLLEWAIAQFLRKNVKIKFWEEHRVKGLICDRQDHIIKGIITKNSDGEKVLTAQLVVDCSGRGSKTPQWLKDLGLTPPPETVVDAHLGYATRRYKEPKADQYPWKVMLINQSPPEHTRLGYLAKIEGGNG